MNYKQIETLARAVVFIIASVWEEDKHHTQHFMQRALENLQDLVGTEAMISVMAHNWEPEYRVAKAHCEAMEARVGVISLTNMESK